MMESVYLTRKDYGPVRKLIDRAVPYVMTFFLGWVVATWTYDVSAIHGLRASAYAWTWATSDRFNYICRELYGTRTRTALP